MRIFLAGATGVIGRHLVPLLIEAGHEVAGMTRTPGKLGWLADLGAQPILVDVFARDQLLHAVASFRPDLVVHQLTDLPDDPKDLSSKTAANNRIRVEGTRNLVDAALSCGSRVLAQSVAWGLPGEAGEAVEFLEHTVLTAGGVVVRYGRFYGPGTYYIRSKPDPPFVGVDRAARRTAELLRAPAGIYEAIEPGEG